VVADDLLAGGDPPAERKNLLTSLGHCPKGKSSPTKASPMSVPGILKTAIWCRRPVEMLVAGRLRRVCPHAIGHENSRLKVLAFQFFGESASGLPSGGAWRSFFLDDIAWAKIIDGPWRSGRNSVAKIEASFDHIDLEIRPRAAASRRAQRLS
jgi:hypothetical protein